MHFCVRFQLGVVLCTYVPFAFTFKYFQATLNIAHSGTD